VRNHAVCVSRNSRLLLTSIGEEYLVYLRWVGGGVGGWGGGWVEVAGHVMAGRGGNVEAEGCVMVGRRRGLRF
jgi:hypothetical protein